MNPEFVVHLKLKLFNYLESDTFGPVGCIMEYSGCFEAFFRTNSWKENVTTIGA
jgi:hypothetical protein